MLRVFDPWQMIKKMNEAEVYISLGYFLYVLVCNFHQAMFHWMKKEESLMYQSAMIFEYLIGVLFYNFDCKLFIILYNWTSHMKKIRERK